MFSNTLQFSFLILILCLINLIKSEKHYAIDGNEYFSSYPAKRNWYQALRYCANIGGELVDIPSAEEERNVLQIVSDPQIPEEERGYFIGGTDLGSPGQWFWTATGQAILYTNWGPEQPDGVEKEENCLEYAQIFKGQWNDVNCLKERLFICRL